MKSWFYGVFISLLSLGANAQYINDISSLQGNEIMWSSPYKKADDAKIIFVNKIIKGENFYDNGDIIINDSIYPIDQLFVKNKNDKYENLLSLVRENIISGTFFIKYYNKNLLAINDEITKIRSDVEQCIGNFNSGGIKGVEKETSYYEKCLDDIYYKCVDVFYTNSRDELLENYTKISEAIKENYLLISNPDYCYGKCGSVSFMKSYNKILEIKKMIVLDLLDNIVVEDKRKNSKEKRLTNERAAF